MMQGLVGRLSRVAAKKLLSPRKRTSWNHQTFTSLETSFRKNEIIQGSSPPFPTILLPKGAPTYIGPGQCQSRSWNTINSVVEDGSLAWRRLVAQKIGQSPSAPSRVRNNGTSRRHMATEQKGPELSKPRQAEAPPKPPQQDFEGNSFVFVGARKENFFTLTWRRVVGAGRAVAALGQVPIVPLGLGLAGAIPFVALAPPISSYAPLPDVLRGRELEAQAAYGACILSFLGGPHWGLAMAASPESGRAAASFTASSFRYAWSVVPSLLAWPALLLPPVQKFALLIGSFGLALGVDTTMTGHALLPKWFLPLRVALTSVAVLSMGASLSVAAAKPLMSSSSKASGEQRDTVK